MERQAIPSASHIVHEDHPAALEAVGQGFLDRRRQGRVTHRRGRWRPRSRGSSLRASMPTTVDEYLATRSPEQRAALEQLRRTIRAAAPEAEECISYQLPAFRHHGMLVAFGATKSHCAFYLMSASTLAAHKSDLEGYDTSKGTIRFQPDQPLPGALVRKLVKARVAENEARRSASRH